MNQSIRAWILLASVAVAAAGCADTRPRVLEVTHRTYREDISPIDEEIFARDRAGHFEVNPQPLPASEQRQEFYVRWTPPAATLVKFEYRQVNAPDRVQEQTYRPEHRTAKVFAIRGKAFADGGLVSAWRVSIWRDGQLLADQTSALW